MYYVNYTIVSTIKMPNGRIKIPSGTKEQKEKRAFKPSILRKLIRFIETGIA